MARTKDPSATDVRPSAENREKGKVPRREALKSLVAGLTAAPLLSGKPWPARQGESPAVQSFYAGNARNQLFDSGWRFHRGDAPGAENMEFDDSAWHWLDLPHDWSIEALSSHPQENGQGAVWGGIDVPLQIGPFDMYGSEGQRATGWCVGGVGWYRKRFRAKEVRAGGQAEILFEGVYMNSDVWLNGHHLGFHP